MVKSKSTKKVLKKSPVTKSKVNNSLVKKSSVKSSKTKSVSRPVSKNLKSTLKKKQPRTNSTNTIYALNDLESMKSKDSTTDSSNTSNTVYSNPDFSSTNNTPTPTVNVAPVTNVSAIPPNIEIDMGPRTEGLINKFHPSFIKIFIGVCIFIAILAVISLAAFLIFSFNIVSFMK